MAAVPADMNGIIIDGKGGPEVLKLARLPVPLVGPGQILVKVGAAGVNRPDIQQRIGAYPPPQGHSKLPGLEVAGHVAEIGAGVVRWKVGDAVCALVNGGGYAHYTVAEDSVALPIPAGIDMIHAAALPETVFTVWNNVFDKSKGHGGDRTPLP